jgi:predicted amidohydrolase
MVRKVTLGAVQPPLCKRETFAAVREAHLDAVAGLLAEAAGRAARLAVLPEMLNVVGAAQHSMSYREAAEPIDGQTVETVRQLASRYDLAVVLPIYRLDDAGQMRNTAVVIDGQGDVLGWYDKVHPTRGEIASGVVPGDTWPVFDLGFARLGVMICHDNSFVESARCLALAGAEIIAWPHVQSGWGDVMWDITLRSRAIDNGVYLISSCYAVRGAGAWRPGMMVGRSGVVAPDGHIMAEMAREAGVATATVDLDDPRLVHSFSIAGEFPFDEEFRRDRRPNTYGLLVAEPKTLPTIVRPSAPAAVMKTAAPAPNVRQPAPVGAGPG